MQYILALIGVMCLFTLPAEAGWRREARQARRAVLRQVPVYRQPTLRPVPVQYRPVATITNSCQNGQCKFR